VRWVKQRRIQPSMGLWSGGCSLAAARSCGGGAMLELPLDGGGGMVVASPLRGGGGGSGHTTDPTSRESGPASLAPSLDARVLVGRPRGSIRIRVVCLYVDLGGMDSGTEMTSIGSSSLSMTTAMTTSSSSLATSSSPRPLPGDEDTSCHCVTEYGRRPIPWMTHGGSRRLHGESAGSEGSIGL
jgi:hypothetical protein